MRDTFPRAEGQAPWLVAPCSMGPSGVIPEVRLMRDGVQIYKGKIGSLKRFKDDASEVRNGMECGINIQNFNDVKKGDVIEAFVTERIAAEMGVA